MNVFSKFASTLLFPGLLICCTQTQQTPVSSDSDSIASVLQAQLPDSALAPEVAPEDELPVTQADLRFEHIVVTAWFEDLLHDRMDFERVYQDSILVFLGLSSKVSGQTYSLSFDSTVQHIEIFQNYETSLTLQNEGPHLDLVGWKHYIDRWKKLEITNGTFTTLEYTEPDSERFPDVTAEEIHQATKDILHGEGDEWVALAEKCAGPLNYPCSVSISRINLKLVLTYTSGITVERFIIFDIPMGC